jgi:hypothetical protein
LKYTEVGGKAFLNSFVKQSTFPEPNDLHFCPFFLEGRTYLFDLDFNLGDDNIYTVGASTVPNTSFFSLILLTLSCYLSFFIQLISSLLFCKAVPISLIVLFYSTIIYLRVAYRWSKYTIPDPAFLKKFESPCGFLGAKCRILPNSVMCKIGLSFASYFTVGTVPGIV